MESVTAVWHGGVARAEDGEPLVSTHVQCNVHSGLIGNSMGYPLYQSTPGVIHDLGLARASSPTRGLLIPSWHYRVMGQGRCWSLFMSLLRST